jgi:hypothetical protein
MATFWGPDLDAPHFDAPLLDVPLLEACGVSNPAAGRRS